MCVGTGKPEFDRARAIGPPTESTRMRPQLSSALLFTLLIGCDDPRQPSSQAGGPSNDTGWARLPSSREAACTDSTWICARWKDEEWDRGSAFKTGTVAFVTVRAVDTSFTERLQINCPTAAYRIVWLSSGGFDTLSMPNWLPVTSSSERALYDGVCKNGPHGNAPR